MEEVGETALSESAVRRLASRYTLHGAKTGSPDLFYQREQLNVEDMELRPLSLRSAEGPSLYSKRDDLKTMKCELQDDCSLQEGSLGLEPPGWRAVLQGPEQQCGGLACRCHTGPAACRTTAGLQEGSLGLEPPGWRAVLQGPEQQCGGLACRCHTGPAAYRTTAGLQEGSLGLEPQAGGPCCKGQAPGPAGRARAQIQVTGLSYWRLARRAAQEGLPRGLDGDAKL
ncbi:Glycine--tRNA ligase alpha subunit [Frankliniella fusca]|uniref:Glycine--tRNA ligase alpha subunit n=1 Tax=Frankliniella fusca TaxID=407009 RepID=A0AAE1HKT1_9NEOP|nr:Glycine--tRNA ligase alpha subunit [Frankliniella fusca]